MVHSLLLLYLTRLGKAVVTGEVSRLERQRSDATGLITLIARIDDQDRRIKVELSEPEYGLASQANQERRLIKCRGDLVKEGRIFTLINPVNFEIT